MFFSLIETIFSIHTKLLVIHFVFMLARLGFHALSLSHSTVSATVTYAANDASGSVRWGLDSVQILIRICQISING